MADVPARHMPFYLVWTFAVLSNTVQRTDFFTTPLCSALVCVGIAVFVSPSSSARFALFNFLAVLHYFIHSPNVGNHELFYFLVSLAIALSFGWSLVRKHHLGREDDYLITAGPSIRFITIGMYAFAVLAKLNTDYLDPHLSCGGVMPFAFVAHWPDVSPFDAPAGYVVAKTILAISGLVCEAGILVCLLRRQTVLYAILLGLGLHGFLGVFFVWHFSPMLYAVYLLFLSPEQGDAVAARWRELASTEIQLGQRLRVSLAKASRVAGWSCLVILPIGAWAAHELPGWRDFATWGRASRGRLARIWMGPGFNIESILGWLPFLALSGLMLWTTLELLRRRKEHATSTQQGYFRASVLSVGLTLFTVVHGVAPYLGLKTQLAFSMFSNLYTEGGKSNHLFIPASWQVFDYQRDLVTFTSDTTALIESQLGADRTSLPWATSYMRPGYQVPYYSLRSAIAELTRRGITKINLSFERNGVSVQLSNAELDPELSQPYPYLIEKFTDFRPILRSGPRTCTY